MVPPAFEFAWIDSNTNRFHRSNKPISTERELERAIAHRSMYGDACFRSVYSFTDFRDRSSAIIDCVYIDMDKKSSPQEALDDAAKVSQYIGDQCTIYFSGFKGVGMLVHCNPVPLLPSMKSAVLRRWTYDLIDRLNLTTVDHAPIGDINRVHRIIDTRHQKTGLYAIGLHRRELSSLTIDEVKAMAICKRGLVQAVHPSSEVSQQLLRIEGVLLVERLQRFVDKRMLAQSTFDGIIDGMSQHPESRDVVMEFIQSLDDEYQSIVAKNAPRCSSTNRWIAEAENALRTNGQLTNGRDRGKEHQARVHFVKYVHECGWGFREICNAFVNIVDGSGKRCYDAKMTEDQVRSCIR